MYHHQFPWDIIYPILAKKANMETSADMRPLHPFHPRTTAPLPTTPRIKRPILLHLDVPDIVSCTHSIPLLATRLNRINQVLSTPEPVDTPSQEYTPSILPIPFSPTAVTLPVVPQTTTSSPPPSTGRSCFSPSSRWRHQTLRHSAAPSAALRGTFLSHRRARCR
jgi:hypothetical protein